MSISPSPPLKRSTSTMVQGTSFFVWQHSAVSVLVSSVRGLKYLSHLQEMLAEVLCMRVSCVVRCVMRGVGLTL